MKLCRLMVFLLLLPAIAVGKQECYAFDFPVAHQMATVTHARARSVLVLCKSRRSGVS